MMPRSHRARARGERGAQLLEFALVLPVFLLVVGGMIDMGLVLKDYLVVTNAAREGGRLAATEAGTTAAVIARVDGYISGGGLTGTAATGLTDQIVTNPDGSAFRAVTVVVSYPHRYLVLAPIASLVSSSVFPTVVTLSASCTMRKEIAATQ